VTAAQQPAPAPSQVRNPGRTVARTVFQLVIGLAAAIPELVTLSGVPQTVSSVGVGLAAAAVVTRVMAIPQVDAALQLWAPWLAAEPGSGQAAE
jgi:hypothetical protein